MKIALLLLSVWLPSASSELLDVKPEVSSVALIQGLRTPTTVTLAKPICVFSTGGVVEVEVFGVQTTADYVEADPDRNGREPQAELGDRLPASAAVGALPNEIRNMSILTYQETRGGASGPYRAASFGIPICTSSPFLLSRDPAVIREQIERYLFRVGNDVQCLNQVPFVSGNCNAPLKANVPYRFKYVVRDTSTDTIINETLWSDPIPVLRVADFSVIDTWPGARTGGMVVITTILVILLFLLLCGFVALLVYACCLKEETLAMDQQPVPRTYITHQKNIGFADLKKEGLKPAAPQPTEQAHYQEIEAASQAPVYGH